jgi:beta-galactosidase/beta-glucuronidase
MSQAGYGEPYKDVPQKAWGRLYNEPVWHPVLRYDYRGAAWYQRDITVYADLEGKYFQLYLERVCWVSDVWLDGRYIGQCSSLSAPHRYDLGVLKPGKHRISIRVDNRQLHYLGCNTHAYHEQSCTIYNGIIGRIYLAVRQQVFADDVQVYPDVENEKCRITFALRNTTSGKVSGKANISIAAKESGKEIVSQSTVYNAVPGQTNISVILDVPSEKIKKWDEFSHQLYVAGVEVESTCGKDKCSVTFGFRKFEGRGAQFFINGKPVLMRGEASNAMFPLTGYPAMTRQEWRKIFKLYKDFGINHLRCHSWTPPEAAFEVADEMGVYIQSELPNC